MGHCGECYYRRMAEVMEQLDAARDDLLDQDNKLVGRVKNKEEVEKRLRHKLLQRIAWQLIPSSSSSCFPPRMNCTNGD